jgi:hypothetical protein
VFWMDWTSVTLDSGQKKRTERMERREKRKNQQNEVKVVSEKKDGTAVGGWVRCLPRTPSGQVVVPKPVPKHSFTPTFGETNTKAD